MANFVGTVLSTITDVLEINQATLSGAIDIVVVRRPDGSLVCTPFHVRFGKLQVFRSKEKVVSLEVNDKAVPLKMKLGSAGEAFFVEETSEPVPRAWATSPLASLSDSQSEGNSSSVLQTDAVQPEAALLTTPPEPGSESFSPGHKRRWSWGWGEIPTESGSHRPRMSRSKTDTRLADRVSKAEEMALDRIELDASVPFSGALPEKAPEPAPDPLPTESSWMGAFFSVFRGRGRDTATQDSSSSSFLTDTLQASVLQEEPEEPPAVDLALCGSHLAPRDIEALGEDTLPQDRQVFERNVITWEQFVRNPMVIYDEQIVVRVGERLLPLELAVPIVLGYMAFGQLLPTETLVDLARAVQPKQPSKAAVIASLPIRTLSDQEREEGEEEAEGTEEREGEAAAEGEAPQRQHWASWLFGSGEPVERDSSDIPLGDEELRSALSSEGSGSDDGLLPAGHRKSLRPTSDQLEQLDLVPGSNVIRFRVRAGFQGEQTVTARVFLFNHDAKIVVSDIDGTITRSDVLGQILPALGQDWSHVGVAELYSRIAANGYQFLYLTSRAVGQASSTRGYLLQVRQGEQKLPDGPVIMSPDRLLQSFRREVIHRTPQIFKIAALSDVRSLFLDNPLYAGFGNRETDVVAYEEVGVPLGRIFTIDPSGAVQIQLLQGQKISSYGEIGSMVDAVFPPRSIEEDPAYHEFQYWRTPIEKVE